jgi:N-acetylglucosaminyl-diphospho-decaprenol L-rhamnosyltransferase
VTGDRAGKGRPHGEDETPHDASTEASPLFAVPPFDAALIEERFAAEAEVRARLGARPEPHEVAKDPREVVGAVVVTFGDEAHVAAMLRELVPGVARVVVVDLSSEDDTEGAIRRALPQLELAVLPTEAGFGAALNEGVRRLDQDYVLSLHGDARLRPGALQRLLDLVSAGRRPAAAAGARLAGLDGTVERAAGYAPTLRGMAVSGLKSAFPALEPARFKSPWRFAPTGRAEVDWIDLAAAMLRRDAFEAVGGMDESYFLAYGSIDLCLRLRAAGHKVVADGGARALHLDQVVESAGSRRAARRRFGATYGPLRAARRLLRV